MSKVYVASKLYHAGIWRQARLDYPEIHFTARWPYLVSKVPDEAKYAKNFWLDDLRDVADANVILVYAEPADRLRGALIEAGAALALGKVVWLVGQNESYGTWQHHPLVKGPSDRLKEVLNRLASGKWWHNALD